MKGIINQSLFFLVDFIRASATAVLIAPTIWKTVKKNIVSFVGSDKVSPLTIQHIVIEIHTNMVAIIG